MAIFQFLLCHVRGTGLIGIPPPCQTSSLKRDRRFADSPLEEAGFEPSVPRKHDRKKAQKIPFIQTPAAAVSAWKVDSSVLPPVSRAQAPADRVRPCR